VLADNGRVDPTTTVDGTAVTVTVATGLGVDGESPFEQPTAKVSRETTMGIIELYDIATR